MQKERSNARVQTVFVVESRCKSNDDNGIAPFRALRVITKSDDKTPDEKAKIDVVEEDVRNTNAIEAKAGAFEGSCYNGKCNIVMCLFCGEVE